MTTFLKFILILLCFLTPIKFYAQNKEQAIAEIWTQYYNTIKLSLGGAYANSFSNKELTNKEIRIYQEILHTTHFLANRIRIEQQFFNPSTGSYTLRLRYRFLFNFNLKNKNYS